MSMRVLMIDDHALFRVGLQGLLEQRGIQVVAAVAEGYEGLTLAKGTGTGYHPSRLTHARHVWP